MSCYHPLQAYRLDDGQILFHDKGHGRPLELPCGQCIGCRIQKSKEWALRCVHEASLHDNNCFITLTYDDEKLIQENPMHPALVSGSLYKRDFQLFLKRLRKELSPTKIKFYMCGEYGDQRNRPHYHSLIFGYNFPDWLYLFDSPSGEPIYTSPILERIWGKGFVTVGTCTYDSAGYVARYCMKKLNGPLAEQINPDTGLRHYERVNSYTGEIISVIPEYSTMSRGGTTGHGIADGWRRQFLSDCYPKDFTTINGVRMSTPKYYDKYLENIDPVLYDEIKQGRIMSMLENSADNTVARLATKEKVKEAQYNQYTRSL